MRRCHACGEFESRFDAEPLGRVKAPALLVLCRSCRRQAEATKDRAYHHHKLLSAVEERMRIYGAP